MRVGLSPVQCKETESLGSCSLAGCSVKSGYAQRTVHSVCAVAFSCLRA